jgi:hypothetical protein
MDDPKVVEHQIGAPKIEPHELIEETAAYNFNIYPLANKVQPFSV